MKRLSAILASAALLLNAASGKNILIVGTAPSDDCLQIVPHLVSAAGADIQIALSDGRICGKGCTEFKDSSVDIKNGQWDLVVFRAGCTEEEIGRMKSSLRKNASAYAIEGNSSRMGITALISDETVAANIAGTKLCSGDNGQFAYAKACCWFEVLTGESPLGNAYRAGITRDEIAGILQQCGSEAARNPGTVSRIDEHWYLPFIPSQWNGKRVVFLGDSITDENQLKGANDVYWHMLEKLLGIKALVYGINGHQMSDIMGQAHKMEAEIKDGFDAIMIFAGTNDYNSNVPLGEWFTYAPERVNDHGTDTTMSRRSPSCDGGTFRGRTNTVLSSLKSRFPDKQIIVLTPLHRSWANFGGSNIQPEENFGNRIGLHIDDYVQCLKEASMIWSVPVIDLFAEAGIHPGIESHGKFFRCPEDNRDLLHPNTAGHIRMAYTIAYRMTSIPVAFPEIFPL